jgi:hypothetical protein
MKTVTCAALALGILVTSGQALAETIMIRNATVHTMSDDGVLQATDVLVSGRTIKSIGQGLPVPEDARVIDAAGRNLTPALFGGISEIGLAEVSAVDESVDNSVSGVAKANMRPEFDVSLAFNPASTLVPVARVEGLGFTLLGASAADGLIGGQGRLAWLDGSWTSLFGNRVLFVGVGGVSEKQGGSRAAQWMVLDQVMDEAEEAPRQGAASVLTRAGRETLKAYAEGGTVVFEVNRASDILQTLRFADRHGFEVVISGGAEAWKVARQLYEADVPVLLDPLVNLPQSFDMLGARLDNAALLHAAGVTIGISGNDGHNARKVRQMAGNAVANGLPHEAALAALTINPARIFGVARQTGSIETGKRADLVLWSGDPLEVTSLPDAVIINGKQDSLQSRQTLLRDRYLVEDPALPRAYLR